jgi:hypothetical protein
MTSLEAMRERQPLFWIRMEANRRALRGEPVDYQQLFAEAGVARPTAAEIELHSGRGLRMAARQLLRSLSYIAPGGKARFQRDEIVSLYVRAPQPREDSEMLMRMQSMDLLRLKGMSADERFRQLGIPIPTEAELAATDPDRPAWRRWASAFGYALAITDPDMSRRQARRTLVHQYRLLRLLDQA